MNIDQQQKETSESAIELSQGKRAFVDDEDRERLSRCLWHINSGGYAVRHTSRRLGKPGVVLMHREIVEYAMGEPIPEGCEVDHVDLDRLNNRRDNLRLVTRSQNQMNRRSYRGSASQYKGVSWHKKYGKWQVRAQANGKSVFLGYFADETEAARVYDAKAQELFGEFARLNFPDE